MTNKEEEERIARLDLLLERRECFLNFRLRAFLVRQNDHAVIRESEFFDQRFLSALSPLVELLFVFRGAGDTADDQCARICENSYGQQKNKREEPAQPHARPLFFLQNHSPARLMQRSMKMKGTSHNSFCSMNEVSPSTYWASSGTLPIFESG